MPWESSCFFLIFVVYDSIYRCYQFKGMYLIISNVFFSSRPSLSSTEPTSSPKPAALHLLTQVADGCHLLPKTIQGDAQLLGGLLRNSLLLRLGGNGRLLMFREMFKCALVDLSPNSKLVVKKQNDDYWKEIF